MLSLTTPDRAGPAFLHSDTRRFIPACPDRLAADGQKKDLHPALSRRTGRGEERRPVFIRAVATAALGLLLTGCTVHPPGERAERESAARAGGPFLAAPATRDLPPLPDAPSPGQLVGYALRANAGLAQKYWEWRSAIEQIPQDGTQPTNLAFFGGLGLSRGSTRLDQATLSAGNDPMADIVLPPKLSAAARRALENARAAGLRFRKAQFDLRGQVLAGWYDYALAGELIRLEEANAELLKTTVMVAQARDRAGAAGQQDLLKARNEADLSANDLAALQAQLPVQRAALNALLDRPPDAPLLPPEGLPSARPLIRTDAQVLAVAADRNPELSALAREVAGRGEGVALARLQYFPDLSLSVGTGLTGVAQSLSGMVTVPLLRHEAIDAAVAQAEANLEATRAMLRQGRNDLAARVVADLIVLRDADRQVELFEGTILPRARQGVTLGRTTYESGGASLLDLLDSQRSLIAIRRLVANLRVTREKRLADLEAVTGEELGRDDR